MSTQTSFNPLGMLSMVLGVIGMLLFFMPILGVPLSAIALLFGLIGLVMTLLPGGRGLRHSLQGCAIATLALAINLSLAYGPEGYLPPPSVPPPWQSVPNRPFIPPPSNPRF